MLYLYPTTIGDDVLEAMAESEKVCKYIDLPLQHASDARAEADEAARHARQSYERLLDRIRQRVPGVTLRTTFIVGFPGETDADYAELRVVRRSRSSSTTSASSPTRTRKARRPTGSTDDVPAGVKTAASGRRDATAEADRRARPARAHRPARCRVLVDGPSAEHELVLRGRLEGQAPDIDPLVYLTDCDPSAISAGQFIQAEIVGSRGYDLVAVASSRSA